MSRETLGVGAAGVVFALILSLLAVASSRPVPASIEPPVIAVRPATVVPEKLPEELAEARVVEFQVVGVPEPEPPTLAEDAVAVAVARTRMYGGTLTVAEMLLLLAWTGWPLEWWDEAGAIGWCESKWSPAAVGDQGNSLGMMQLWHGWFWEGEDPFDPVTNLRVALRVRTIRGRFSGNGGWSCADLRGIP